MTQLSRILAAVDFSKVSYGAFEHALALSTQHGAELVVVHAVPRNHAFAFRASERIALRGKLLRRAQQAGVSFRMTVQHGDPAKVVLLHARTLRPDVIVVGTHQRRGLDRLRVGSVAARIATRAAVPVLLVPPQPDAGGVKPFSHVAVAIDFSDGSRRALDHALSLTVDGTDRVTLLHVVPGFSSGVPPHFYRYGLTEYQSALVREARTRLQSAVPAQRQTAASIETRVLVGDTSAEISRVTDSLGADLLVVGASKRGAVGRAVFGTTAGRLLRASRVPVLAIPGAGERSAEPESASLQLAA